MWLDCFVAEAWFCPVFREGRDSLQLTIYLLSSLRLSHSVHILGDQDSLFNDFIFYTYLHFCFLDPFENLRKAQTPNPEFQAIVRVG